MLLKYITQEIVKVIDSSYFYYDSSNRIFLQPTTIQSNRNILVASVKIYVYCTASANTIWQSLLKYFYRRTLRQFDKN